MSKENSFVCGKNDNMMASFPNSLLWLPWLYRVHWTFNDGQAGRVFIGICSEMTSYSWQVWQLLNQLLQRSICVHIWLWAL